jgi:hypothetical protein
MRSPELIEILLHLRYLLSELTAAPPDTKKADGERLHNVLFGVILNRRDQRTCPVLGIFGMNHPCIAINART